MSTTPISLVTKKKRGKCFPLLYYFCEKIEKGTVVYTGNDFLAIRKGASTSSDMIGKLTKNCGAVKTGAREGDWVEVTSGEIKGWVYEKDTIYGKDLQKYVLDNLKEKYGTRIIKRATERKKNNESRNNKRDK